MNRSRIAIVCVSSILLFGFQNCSGHLSSELPSAQKIDSSSTDSSSSVGGGGNSDSTTTTSGTTATSGTTNTVACSPLNTIANPYATSEPTILVNNKSIIPIPNKGTYPAKSAVVTDPVTGFKVTRFADKSELVGDYGNHKSPISAIVYSRYTPANVTGEFVLVHGDNSTSAWIYRVSDNKMIAPIKFNKTADPITGKSIGEVNEIRWNYTCDHPYRFYFVGHSVGDSSATKGENVNMSFYYMDLDPQALTLSAPTLIHDFSAEFPVGSYPNALIMNDVEGDSSNDSRYWAWQVMDSGTGGTWLPYAFLVYDRVQNKVLSTMQPSCSGYTKAPCVVIVSPTAPAKHIRRPNMVEMSPSGLRVVIHFEYVPTDPQYGETANVNTMVDGPKAFLKDFSDPVRIGSDASHSGWAWGPNGEEMFVSQNNRNDWIEAVDIASTSTAKCSLIPNSYSNAYTCGIKSISYPDLDGGSWSIGMHFGKVYDRTKKGFLFMNTYNAAATSNTWAKNQNLLVAIQDATKLGSKVIRLGSSYNQYYDYRSEGSGALDFNGANIFATANWGFTDGRGDATRIALPASIWKK